MKNKKGFTLVELLAVIAILAILVIMALPAVLRMYRQSRISSFQNEVRAVYRTAQSQFLGDSISLGSGQTIAYTNAGTSVTGVDVVKELDMTGNSDFKYYVYMNVDGKVLNVRATNGTYSYSIQALNPNGDIKIEDIDVEEGNEEILDSNIINELCPNEEDSYNHVAKFVTRQNENAITIGDEVAIKSEHFYVINSDENKTVLLSKYNLLVGDMLDCRDDGYYEISGSLTPNDNGYGLQSSISKGYFSYGEHIIGVVSFASTNYWDNSGYVCNGISCGYTNTKELKSKYGTSYDSSPKVYVYESSMSAIAPQYVYRNNTNRIGFPQNNGYTIAYYVEQYVNTLKKFGASNIEGRLLTYEELERLPDDIVGEAAYWTGSVENSGSVLVHLDGEIRLIGFIYDFRNGVRPVIIVNTSEL